MAVSMKMAVFWVVAPYEFTDVSEVRTASINRRLKSWQTDTSLHGATTQKTAIFNSENI
jgi:hypothetical protein